MHWETERLSRSMTTNSAYGCHRRYVHGSRDTICQPAAPCSLYARRDSRTWVLRKNPTRSAAQALMVALWYSLTFPLEMHMSEGSNLSSFLILYPSAHNSADFRTSENFRQLCTGEHKYVFLKANNLGIITRLWATRGPCSTA